MDHFNLAQVIALLVAIFAIFSGLIIYFVSQHLGKRIEKLELAVETRLTEQLYACRIAENAVHLFVAVDNALQNQYVITTFLLKRNGLRDQALGPYQSAHNKARRSLSKYVQTLLLYSDKKEWRQSAMKQLSEDYGEADTLRLLVELRQRETLLEDDLSRAIAALEERLNSKLRP